MGVNKGLAKWLMLNLCVGSLGDWPMVYVLRFVYERPKALSLFLFIFFFGKFDEGERKGLGKMYALVSHYRIHLRGS